MTSINTRNLTVALFAGLLGSSSLASAADLSCDGLVSPGTKMICSGFEPNWGVVFTCTGKSMSADFLDAFSGSNTTTTPGSATFTSQSPWNYTTSHGVSGKISHTPGACRGVNDKMYDFSHKTFAVPGFSGSVADFCCRIE